MGRRGDGRHPDSGGRPGPARCAARPRTAAGQRDRPEGCRHRGDGFLRAHGLHCADAGGDRQRRELRRPDRGPHLRPPDVRDCPGLPAAQPVAGGLRCFLHLDWPGHHPVSRIHRRMDHAARLLPGNDLRRAADRAVRPGRVRPGVPELDVRDGAVRGDLAGHRHDHRLHRDKGHGAVPVGPGDHRIPHDLGVRDRRPDRRVRREPEVSFLLAGAGFPGRASAGPAVSWAGS